MKLSVQYFRSYKELRTFTFKDCTLLQGASGLGKSTLINSIVWCLYGGNRKYYGHKSGKEDGPTFVMIELPDIIIRRTPKTVEVLLKNNTLQGTEADAYISSIFGSTTLFKASSHIAQSSRCSLIVASAQEKADILHKLTFGEQTISAAEDPQSYIVQIQSKLKVFADEILKQRILSQDLSKRYQISRQTHQNQISMWEKRSPITLTIQDIEDYLLKTDKSLADIVTLRDQRSKYEFQVEEYTSQMGNLKNILIEPKGDIEMMKSKLAKLSSILADRKSQDDLRSEYQSLNASLKDMMDVLLLSKQQQDFEIQDTSTKISQFMYGIELAKRHGFSYTHKGVEDYQSALTNEITEIMVYPTKLKEWETQTKVLQDVCDRENKDIYSKWKIEFDCLYEQEMEYTKKVSSITSENQRITELHNEHTRTFNLLSLLLYVLSIENKEQRLTKLKEKINECQLNKSLMLRYNIKDLEVHKKKLQDDKVYCIEYETLKAKYSAESQRIKDRNLKDQNEYLKECDLIRDENTRSEHIRIAIINDNKNKQLIYDNYMYKVAERNKAKKLYESSIKDYSEKLNIYETDKFNLEVDLVQLKTNHILNSTELKDMFSYIPKSTDLIMKLQQIEIAKNQLKCPCCNVSLSLKDGKTLIKFESQVDESQEKLLIDGLQKLSEMNNIVRQIDLLSNKIANLSIPVKVNEQTFEDILEITLDLVEVPNYAKKNLPVAPVPQTLPTEPVKPRENIGQEMSEVSKITDLQDCSKEEKEYDDILKVIEYDALFQRLDQLKPYEKLQVLRLPEVQTFIKPSQPIDKKAVLPDAPVKPNRTMNDVILEAQLIKDIVFPREMLSQLQAKSDKLKRIPDCTNNLNRFLEIKPIVEKLSPQKEIQSIKDQHLEVSGNIDEYMKLQYVYLNSKERIKVIEDNISNLKAPCDKSVIDLDKLKAEYENNKVMCSNLKNAGLDYDRVTKEFNAVMASEQTLKYFVEREANLTQVLNLVKELESQAIEMTVNALNNEANKILEVIFENDIRIELKTHYEFKSREGSKLQINLQIEYQSCSMAPGDLSGGEQDRLSFSLMLAMAKISDSPFLLLDECMSSIDNNLRSKCLKVLKYNFTNKTIINICHETIQGLYDGVVDLNEDA